MSTKIYIDSKTLPFFSMDNNCFSTKNILDELILRTMAEDISSEIEQFILSEKKRIPQSFYISVSGNTGLKLVELLSEKDLGFQVKYEPNLKSLSMKDGDERFQPYYHIDTDSVLHYYLPKDESKMKYNFAA